jgi:hypothetical protein
MATSIVNGYFCFSSCDVSKAKKGENPHPSTDPANVDAESNGERSRPGRAEEPAVLFGGSLGDLLRADSVTAVDGTQPADPATPRRVGLAVDVLA